MHKDLRAVAEKFLRDQFAIMKKYGDAPTLDAKQYKKLVDETSRTFEMLNSPKVLAAG